MNWVKARLECSMQKVLLQLKSGVKADVDEANISMEPQGYKTRSFDVHENGDNRFSVMRSEQAGAVTVEFANRQGYIEITTLDKKTLQVTPALNADGECHVMLGAQELQMWQLRRLVLEPLFFGPFPKQV
jgi:hypothetical protein